MADNEFTERRVENTPRPEDKPDLLGEVLLNSNVITNKKESAQAKLASTASDGVKPSFIDFTPVEQSQTSQTRRGQSLIEKVNAAVPADADQKYKQLVLSNPLPNEGARWTQKEKARYYAGLEFPNENEQTERAIAVKDYANEPLTNIEARSLEFMRRICYRHLSAKPQQRIEALPAVDREISLEDLNVK